MDAGLADLGDDLAALAGAVGSPLRAVVPLSRRGAGDQPTAFRLHFADGTVLKGCRLASADQAAKAAALVAHLGDCVPRLVGQRGAALLSEWVEGDCLAALTCDEALLRACGAQQGRLHAREPALPPDAATALAASRLAGLTARLAALRAAAVLSSDTAAAAEALARRTAPARCDGGAAFGDYCAENIVRRRDGSLCLIDIETVSTAPHDFDLARTHYRWPMAEHAWAAYLDGYRAHRDPAPFLAHRPFWMLAAVADSLHFRHAFRPAGLPVPRAALAALLAEAAGDWGGLSRRPAGASDRP